MHDNDGFSSLNKDLFTLPPTTHLTCRRRRPPRNNFDVSSGFVMILFLLQAAEGEISEGRRVLADVDV